MGDGLQIQGDRFVATAQAPQPPRVDRDDATAQVARQFIDWMASEGYDPARLDAMTANELGRMFTESPDGFDADEAQVQALLIIRGYEPGPIDGWYGPETKGAVAQFQEDHGIEPADGIMTPETLEAMKAAAGESGETSDGVADGPDTAGSSGSSSVADAGETTDAAVNAAIGPQENLDSVFAAEEADGAYTEDETAVDSAVRRNNDAQTVLDDALGDEIDATLAANPGMTSEQAAEAIRARHADDPAKLAAVDAALARQGIAVENGTMLTGERNGEGRYEVQNYVDGEPVGEPYFADIAPNGQPANSAIVDADGNTVRTDGNGEPLTGTYTWTEEAGEVGGEMTYVTYSQEYVDGEPEGPSKRSSLIAR